MQFDVKEIADRADMIINGYAFTKEGEHVHASDRKLTKAGSAKFFVMNNGDTTVERQGQLSEREIRKIREFIKKHYKEVYFKWQEIANIGYYGENV